MDRFYAAAIGSARAAPCRARMSRSSFRRSSVLFEDAEPRLLPRRRAPRRARRRPCGARRRPASSCSRSALSRSRIAVLVDLAGLRPGQPPQLLRSAGCAPAGCRRRVCCSCFSRVTNCAVLRVAQLQRVLRLDERVGVEHVDALRRAISRRLPRLGRARARRWRLRPAPAASPRRPRRRPANVSENAMRDASSCLMLRSASIPASSSRTSSARSAAVSSSAGALDRSRRAPDTRRPARRRSPGRRPRLRTTAHACVGIDVVARSVAGVGRVGDCRRAASLDVGRGAASGSSARVHATPMHDQHGRRGCRRQRQAGPAATTSARRRRASIAVRDARGEVLPEQRRRFAARRRRPLGAASSRSSSTLRAARRAGAQRAPTRDRRAARRRRGRRTPCRRQVRHVHSSVQQLLQVRQRVKEVRLRRRPTELPRIPRDLLVRQIVIHAQDQRRALLRRQPRDRGAHARRRVRRAAARRPPVRLPRPPVDVWQRCERRRLERRRFRQTLTPIRYSQVPNADCPLEPRSPR